jgi:16S rRNA (cytosine1402-N4)-methyltransferase
MNYHNPVMMAEVIAHLNVRESHKYIDMTLGDAGHTLEILRKGGLVLGIDINETSLERATSRVKKEGLEKGFHPRLGNFKDVHSLAINADFTEVDGIIYDLGYSSYQLEDAELGLSFQSNSPLDMRLTKELGVTAADLVNSLSEKELARVIFDFSGERFAKRIAKAIVHIRNLKKIQTTRELAEIIKSETPPDYENGRIHPATRTFQALRILVNDEMNNLEISLPRAAQLLATKGRMIVITFHSLEDKLVKQFGQGAQPQLSPVNVKPFIPTEEEISRNFRARSAKMRVFEKA